MKKFMPDHGNSTIEMVTGFLQLTSFSTIKIVKVFICTNSAKNANTKNENTLKAFFKKPMNDRF